jgi:hypothetical protein
VLGDKLLYELRVYLVIPFDDFELVRLALDENGVRAVKRIPIIFGKRKDHLFIG